MKDINYRVIAFDPGGTTGWSTYSAHKSGSTYTQEEWACGHLDQPNHHQQLKILLGNQRVRTYKVVCEKFNDRPGATNSVNLIARDYIGVVELYCQEEGIELHRQMPATAKGFVKDKNMRAMGLFVRNWKHAMDARRHLLWFLIHRENRFEFLATGWPNG
jgi:hypothetical protein